MRKGGRVGKRERERERRRVDCGQRNSGKGSQSDAARVSSALASSEIFVSPFYCLLVVFGVIIHSLPSSAFSLGICPPLSLPLLSTKLIPLALISVPLSLLPTSPFLSPLPRIPSHSITTLLLFSRRKAESEMAGIQRRGGEKGERSQPRH